MRRWAGDLGGPEDGGDEGRACPGDEEARRVERRHVSRRHHCAAAAAAAAHVCEPPPLGKAGRERARGRDRGGASGAVRARGAVAARRAVRTADEEARDAGEEEEETIAEAHAYLVGHGADDEADNDGAHHADSVADANFICAHSDARSVEACGFH